MQADTRKPTLFKLLLAASVITLTLSTPVRASEPEGVPVTCHMYDWYDVMSWYYGYAGVCHYSGGGTQHFYWDGSYDNF